MFTRTGARRGDRARDDGARKFAVDIPEMWRRPEKVSEETLLGAKKPFIVEKILLGRMNKYYEEVCLENQKFILDDSMTVGKAVKAEGGELVAFARVKVGEGIEVETKDFAAEVRETVRST